MSAYFDPQDKKNKPVLDYFENKTWLILDNSSGTRTSIKKSIMQIGIKASNITDADNLTAAKEFISSKKPNYIIANKLINGGTTTSLFKLQSLVSGNRLKNGFFLIADESSLSDAAYSLDYDMDGIIILPFTGQTIIECLVNSVAPKITPGPYLLKLEEGRASFLKGDLEKAEDFFNEALSLHKHPYEANYFLGQIAEENKQLQKAVGLYENSIEQNPNYFKSLNRLSSIYFQQKDFKKAYDINVIMSEKYSTPPSKIPELIKLSIVNKKYEDINNYLLLFNAIESPDTETQISLSAGLTVLGKYLFNLNESEKAIDALKFAFKYSNGKYEILKSIAQSFEEHQHLDILMELFNQVDLSSWPEATQGVYFHSLNLTNSDDLYVIMIGEQLLKKKIHEVLIYKGLIERAIKMKRKKGVIEVLVLEAIKHFPEKNSEFEDYLKLL